jgi:hypothetical protein
MTRHVVSHRALYDRVELDEPDYENMLQTWSSHLFPGFRWFAFKPEILSPKGAAHPDAALISENSDEWWVVEVELARHSARTHIDFQLERLRAGIYSPASLNYLASKFPNDKAFFEKINNRRPGFLLIVDEVSGVITQSARESDFELLHVLPFKSISPGNFYIGAADGFSPVKKRRISTTGIVLTLMDDPVVVRLENIENANIPECDDKVMVGKRLVRMRREHDNQTLVLSLGHSEFLELVGKTSHYVLEISAEKSGFIGPLPTLGDK